MITSHDIQDGAVHRVDLSDGVNRDLAKASTPGTAGTDLPRRPLRDRRQRRDRHRRLRRQREKSQKYVAIAGGVQIVNADGDSNVTNDDNPVVADSFPGRMDWATGNGNDAPKPDRLDGWVVRFGSQPMDTPINVWAVCMPRPTTCRSRPPTTDRATPRRFTTAAPVAPAGAAAQASRTDLPVVTARSEGSVLAPHSTTATRSPSAGR